MGNEEHLDDPIEDLEPAAEETDDVKGGLNFTADASFKLGHKDITGVKFDGKDELNFKQQP